MKRNKSQIEKGCETASISPGWIKKKVPDSYADDDLKRIILFYVINTPCVALSSSGISLTEYGWPKDIWKKPALKQLLFDVAGLEYKKTFFSVNKADETKNACEQAKMKKRFHNDRSVEKIVVYRKSGYNDFMSVLYHIRNALAHGRLAMYEVENSKDIVFALEDGVKRNNTYYVRARMILKKSTLIKWIDILECKTEEAKKLCPN